MIVIAGSVPVRPERRADAVRIALEMAAATRAEAGCVAYTFSADLADPNVIHIFEEWETADALAAHFQAPHMARFQAALPDFLAGAPVLKRYEVASAGSF